jgi:carboxyl-terminal processing protease
MQISLPPMARKISTLSAHIFTTLTACLLIASCGGGGGSGGAGGGGATGNGTSSPPAQPFQQEAHPSDVLGDQCVTPRAGTTDRAGSIDTEKAWVRAYMEDTYLWYKDINSVNAANYTAASYGTTYDALDNYFEALKTSKRTASGKLVDEFSFTIPTAELTNLQSGISSGYGIRFAFISTRPPRLLRVLYTEKGSPADLAGVRRGDTVTSVDGIDINDNTAQGIAKINQGLNPTVASKTTAFGLQAAGSSTLRSVNVTSSQNITVNPVAITSTITLSPTKKLGYLALNSFSLNSAEKQLIDAVTQLKAASINELVLDLRYNGGGYLDISNQLSWMIGTPALAGKVYEKISCNDKNPFSICNTADNFEQKSVGFSAPAGQNLPQLGLSRVFVLTSASTCSASESLINGLSPFLQVIRIGSTTCGKPYGFYYADNCGTAYAAMQFSGVNAVGFGSYADGFAPTCQVADDLSKPRGDASELMLAGAINYINTGSCPAVSSGLLKSQPGQKSSGTTELEGNYKVMRTPVEETRILGGPMPLKLPR